jgi:translocation and assembly module TamA
MSSDRLFFAGGQATIRGFDLDSVGPVGSTGKVVGGESLFVLNEELHVPVWGALGVAVFADVGQVWESWSLATFDLSVGAGFGLRYRTPIGPLWADVAWPVANLNVSSPGAKFYFGLGTSF